jgi:hypothetical protein
VNNDEGVDWVVKIDQLQVGDDEPVGGFESLTFSISSYILVLNNAIYGYVEKVLDINSYGQVDCDIQTVIKFKINDADWAVGPEMYVDKSSRNKKTNKCDALIDVSNDVFRLPVTFLSQRCLLLDYKSKRIGFATSKSVYLWR